mmetsp:Transcript_33918/g.88326  ORF Transcript_33918/g.88326 Transcript_33918/m.88326 type:complete len:267 (-) Transcript_33918:307-1107(-)
MSSHITAIHASGSPIAHRLLIAGILVRDGLAHATDRRKPRRARPRLASSGETLGAIHPGAELELMATQTIGSAQYKTITPTIGRIPLPPQLMRRVRMHPHPVVSHTALAVHAIGVPVGLICGRIPGVLRNPGHGDSASLGGVVRHVGGGLQLGRVVGLVFIAVVTHVGLEVAGHSGMIVVEPRARDLLEGGTGADQLTLGAGAANEVVREVPGGDVGVAGAPRPHLRPALLHGLLAEPCFVPHAQDAIIRCAVLAVGLTSSHRSGS